LPTSEENLDAKAKSKQTPLKTQNQKQKLSRKNISELLQSIQEIFYVLDGNWNFVYVNKKMADLSGIKSQDIIGQNIWKLFPRTVGTVIEKYFREAMEKRENKRFEASGIYSNIWYMITVVPSAEGINVLGVDITELKITEEALRRTEKLLTAVTDNSSDAIYVKDCQSRWLFVNPALEKIVGKPSAEVFGKTDSEIYGNNEASKEIMENDRRIMDSGKSETFEESVEYPDGRHSFISVKAPRFDDKGQVIGLVGISHDITERKKIEDALKASEKKANDLIKYAPSGIYELDYRIPPRFRKVNDAMCQILGYSREELLATSPFSLLDQESIIRFQERIKKMLSGEKVDETVEFKAVRKDDREIFVVMNVKFTYKNGKPDGAIVIAHDITERKKAEIALEEWAENLETIVKERTKELELASAYTRSLIEASLDPLVTISSDGKITDVNRATENVTGCTRDELIGSDFSDYFSEPEKARVGFLKVFTEGYVKDYPLSIRHKSGRFTDVLYNAAIYRNSKGEIQGVFAAARDITERKQAEQKLKDVERLANIGATAGMVGHDIRNPLQAITSDVYLLKCYLATMPEMPTKREVAESLDGIEKNVDYINKIVQDLQDYAKPITPSLREIEVAQLFDEVTLKKIIPEKIQVSYKIEKKVDYVVSDRDLLKRVLVNLVNNAAQAMPDGGKLTIHAFEQKQALVITVKDTGVGIPESAKSKIFTPMFTTKSKGQGFGLAVVKRIIEGLGGTVTFESEEHKGTTFMIRLPRQKLNSKNL
jgi:PAS domain S-box-containing protein